MALALACINFISPIAIIEKKYPGGWEQCKSDYARSISYDDHLMRLCSMNPHEMEQLVNHWGKMGFETYVENGDSAFWSECCIVDQLGGVTLPCEWLTTANDKRSVYLKGTDPGIIVG